MLYIFELYITEREKTLIFDARFEKREMYINDIYRINIHCHNLFTNIYIQFGSQCFKRKSFISFTIRKIIYDAISQWHPKWNQKNTYKIMQEKIFAKNILTH